MPPIRRITMWDFSWIERRWPGAGFEDWQRAISELKDRGYDSVRIDAFPHLYAEGPDREWTLKPIWTVQDWGSPGKVRVQIRRSLFEFIALCRENGILVALSSWFREDETNARMKLSTPQAFADAWLVLLRDLYREGLLDAVMYVDLCNEWPGDIWTPFFQNDPPSPTFGAWHTRRSLAWMKVASERVRAEFPEIPLGFSYTTPEPERVAQHDLSFLDFADPHIWMTQADGGEFYRQIGYNYERFTLDGYNVLVDHAEKLYRSDMPRWQDALKRFILANANAYKPSGTPLFTTECWGVVDYKDWPLLDWGWVKELCEIGVETALSTGQWCGVATSNFAAPQFVGMWSDVAWHQKQNARISTANAFSLDPESRMMRRLRKLDALRTGG